jgi:hypothetical protein
MFRLSIRAYQAACAAAAMASLVGCSGGGISATAPKPASQQNGRMNLRLNHNTGHHFKSFYACPANGTLVYASDPFRNVVYVYSGKLAGQAPCAHMASELNQPWGLYVMSGTHDLYVAENGNVRVYHRGQTTPYNTYTDPSRQIVSDVTAAPDGTVIAANFGQTFGTEQGSISTWIGGQHGGQFVGNFPMKNNGQGAFISVQKNGAVFFDDFDSSTDHGAIFSLSCPAGVCGAQTQLSGVSLGDPGGLGFDSTGDLLATDNLNARADTFELPNPRPKSFPLEDAYPTGMAFDGVNQAWLVANWSDNEVDEYSYPSGTLIGTVPGKAGGGIVGVAIDP